MHSHIPVLGATGITPAHRVDGDGVQRAKMALDPANLVFEDAVIEARLELALPGGRLGDFHGGLAAAEDNKVLFGGDGGCVERGVGHVGFEEFEGSGGYYLFLILRVLGSRCLQGSLVGEDEGNGYLCGFVFGGGDEVSSVWCPLKICDRLAFFMSGEVVEEFSALGGG